MTELTKKKGGIRKRAAQHDDDEEESETVLLRCAKHRLEACRLQLNGGLACERKNAAKLGLLL